MTYNALRAASRISNVRLCRYDSSSAFYQLFEENGDVGGWDLYNNIVMYGSWSGMLFGTASDRECYIGRSTSIVPVEAEDYYLVHIMMKITNNNPDRVRESLTTGRLQWTTSDDGLWDNEKQLDFDLVVDDTWRLYEINLGPSSKWVGNVNNLRVYPFVDANEGDHFAIKYIKISSNDKWKCTNTDCSYYVNYEHNCPGAGLRGVCTSGIAKTLYSVEEGVDDTFIVNIDGYGQETVHLGTHKNVSGIDIARVLSSLISSSSIGCMTFAEVQWSYDTNLLSIYSGWYGSDSSVEVIDTPCARILGFFDVDGTDMSVHTNGVEPADGFDNKSARLLSAFELNKLVDGDLSKPSYIHQPTMFNLEGGRRDYNELIVRPDENISESGTVIYNNKYKTVIDVSHPFNNNGILTYIYLLGKKSTSTIGKAMVCRPYNNGTFKVIHSFNFEDKNPNYHYTRTPIAYLIECPVGTRVKKGDVLAIYNMDMYVAYNTLNNPDATFYHITGEASSTFDPGVLLSYGISGFSVYARGSRREDSISLEVDLGKRINIGELRVYGSEYDGYCEYNVARCVDVNWEADCYGLTHKHTGLTGGAGFTYYHPNIVYGLEALSDGKLSAEQGLAGNYISIDRVNVGISTYGEHSYCYCNGDAEWIDQEFPYPDYLGAITEDFAEDKITYSLIFPRNIKCNVHRYAVYFKEDDNFNDFELSYYLGPNDNTGVSYISGYFNRVPSTYYTHIGVNGQIYESDTDNTSIKELLFSNPVFSGWKFEHGVPVNWAQVDAAAKYKWSMLDYRFNAVECYGFAITTMQHNSTKITEMEVYSSFDIEPSLVDNILCEFSEYKDIWVNLAFDTIDTELIRAPLAGSPRYFNIELTANTSFYINEISIDVDDSVLLERCGSGVFLDESKINGNNASKAVTLTNTYPLACDLQVSPVKEVFHSSDIVYWNRLNDGTSTEVGPGSYVKKSTNYSIRNDEGQCAINCNAYGLDNLVDGKKAYVYENEYAWRYYGTLASGVSVEYANRGGSHRRTIIIPPVSAKYWKLEQAAGPNHTEIDSISFKNNGIAFSCDNIYIHGVHGRYSNPRIETSFSESHDINMVTVLDHDFSTGIDGFEEVYPAGIVGEWRIRDGAVPEYYDKSSSASSTLPMTLVKSISDLSNSVDVQFKYKHNHTSDYWTDKGWAANMMVWLVLYDLDDNMILSVDNGRLRAVDSLNGSARHIFLTMCNDIIYSTKNEYSSIVYNASHTYTLDISIRGCKISAMLTETATGEVMKTYSNYVYYTYPIKIAKIGVGFSANGGESSYFSYSGYNDVVFYNLTVKAVPVLSSISTLMWSFNRPTPIDTIEIICDALYMPVLYISNTDNNDYVPWCVDGVSFNTTSMYSSDLTVPWRWRVTDDLYVCPIVRGDSYNISYYTQAGDSYNCVFGDGIYSNSYWEPNEGYPHWVGYDFGAGNNRKIQGISITHNGNNYATLFDVQGSNTLPGSNRYDWSDKVWDTIVTLSGVSSTAFYEFYNDTEYRFYRLYGYESTVDGGVGRWRIKELQFLESYVGVNDGMYVASSDTYTNYFAIDLGRRHFIDIVRNVGPAIDNDLFYISRNSSVTLSSSDVDDVNDVSWGTQGDFYDYFDDGWYEDKWIKSGTEGSELLEQNDKIVVNNFGVGTGGRGPTLTHHFGKELKDFDVSFGINCFHTGTSPTQGNGNYVYVDFVDDNDEVKIRLLLYGYDNGITSYLGARLYDKTTQIGSWTTNSNYSLSETNIVDIGRDLYTGKMYYKVNGSSLYDSAINGDSFYKVKFTFLRADTLPYYEVGLTSFEAYTEGYGTDARWVRISLVCGDNIDKRICKLGIYPDIKEINTPDGEYNCSWTGFGAQFTSYNPSIDIAFESTVTGTNNYWGNSIPDFAVNGVSDVYDLNSVWAFDSLSGEDPYLEMDLGSIHSVNKIVLHHSYDPDLYPYTNVDYRLDVKKTDEEEFTTVLSVTGNSDYDVSHIFDPVDVRIARLVITNYQYTRIAFRDAANDQYYDFFGNAIRNVELYTYPYNGYVRSDDWPVVCINLRDYFDVQDHELLNLDVKDGGTWCNEDKFFRYGDSLLDDPRKVRFTDIGSDFTIYQSNVSSGALYGAYYIEYIFDTDVYFYMGRYQIGYEAYNPIYRNMLGIRFEGASSVEVVATNLGSGWKFQSDTVYIPQDGYYVIKGIIKEEAVDSDWGIRYPLVTRTFGRTKWVSVVRDTGSQHAGETALVAGGFYSDPGTDYLSRIRIFGDKKYSATEYYWWWQYRISTLSNDYIITHSGNRTLKVSYPDSSSLEVLSFIEGDHFGIDHNWSIKDFFAFWLYIDDAAKIDTSDGYIKFGLVNNAPVVYYKWNLSNFTIVNGWNYIRCKFELYDEIYPNYSDELYGPEGSGDGVTRSVDDRTLNSLLDLRINGTNTSSISIAFRGKGEAFSMNIDDFHFDRNYYDDDVKYGKGLCLTGYDVLEVPISTIDVTHGTIEFWARFYITSGGTDHFGNYRSFNLFDICNSNNELISLGVKSGGWFEIYAGQLKEQLVFTIEDAVYWGTDDIGSVDINDVVHLAVVWDNTGKLMSNGDTMRFYINNNLMMNSKQTWAITDTKGTVLRFGGSNTVYSYNGNNYGSCVFDNIKVYSYCKEKFYPNEEGVYYDKADEPNNYLEISSDNTEFYGLGSEYLPLVFSQVPSGGEVTFYVRSVKNNDFVRKCLNKTGILRAEWVAPV